MPTKKTKPKSRVRKSSKNNLQFKWYLAIIVVTLVAIVGIVVVRLGFATQRGGSAYHNDLLELSCDYNEGKLACHSRAVAYFGPWFRIRANNGWNYICTNDKVTEDFECKADFGLKIFGR